MGSIIENIRIALIGLGSNKLRAALTMLGITIGVASVVILLSLGQAVEGFIVGEFTSIGSNLMFILPSADEDGVVDDLTQQQSDALADLLRAPDVQYVMPRLNVNLPITYNGKDMDAQTQGVTPDYVLIQNVEITDGRFFTDEETDNGARVAVIGAGVVERLFNNAAALGDYIRVGNVRFEVIGVLAPASGGFTDDDTVLVPVTTAQTRLSGQRVLTGELPISLIMLQARDGDSVDAAYEQVERVLREERGVEADEESNFQIISQTSILDTLTAVIGIFTLFLGIVAGISLLVGGIGVMNIMLVTVTERTREIGLRKAVGAQSGDIILQFLVEAVTMTLIGGAIGILIAFGAASLAGALIASLAVSVQLSSILLAVGISVAIGVFFGIYPARRAAHMNPIEALRYE